MIIATLSRAKAAPIATLLMLSAPCAWAQNASNPDAPGTDDSRPSLEQKVTELSHEVDELKALVLSLKAQLEKGTPPAATVQAPAPASVASGPASSPAAIPSTAAPPPAASASTPALPGPPANAPATPVVALLPGGITVNGLLDGYYEYNMNSPVGRVNELRAYDVSSNSFSLNQADLVIERAADPASGQRIGMRVDLQYGQATSTLQGNPANELRPDIYRNVFQAYGTYVFPVAAGLTVDFGKWASSLGIEGNYTKDQLNYSRSFWFDYLPFYHAGLRAKLAVNDQWAVNLWVVNGTDQTEAFNNYKDQMFGFVFTPTSTLAWTVNYYQGQEHPDVEYLASQPATGPVLPNEQGTYILPIADPPDGKLQIIDTYMTWQVTKELLVAAEADYVQQRLYSYSSPQRVQGGALYAGYQITPMVAVAVRAEYLADVGGLFSGTTQYLKEGTLTLDYRPADGFLVRGEFRRDQSNQHYFLSNTLGVFESAQPTVGLGLVWWFGQKAGAW